MKTKINAFFHPAGGMECEERCVFSKTCANHETSEGFRAEGGFSPGISIEGEDIFCETKGRPVLSGDFDYDGRETLPENYNSLDRGMVCKEPDGSLSVYRGVYGD